LPLATDSVMLAPSKYPLLTKMLRRLLLIVLSLCLPTLLQAAWQQEPAPKRAIAAPTPEPQLEFPGTQPIRAQEAGQYSLLERGLVLDRVLHLWVTTGQVDVTAERDDFDSEFDAEFAKADEEKSDPLAGYNRLMTGFNDWMYFAILDPVATGYTYVVPEGGRRSVDNFFENLLFPVRFANNLLQAKMGGAAQETARFTLNTTIGILGLFDPAQAWFGLEARPEDFGQTLGYWGVPAGPHIVLPFLGPNNLRDVVGDYSLDVRLDPIYYHRGGPEAQYGLWIYKEVNWTSLHLGEYDSLRKDALDLYQFLRDAYEANRIKKIKE